MSPIQNIHFDQNVGQARRSNSAPGEVMSLNSLMKASVRANEPETAPPAQGDPSIPDGKSFQFFEFCDLILDGTPRTATEILALLTKMGTADGGKPYFESFAEQKQALGYVLSQMEAANPEQYKPPAKPPEEYQVILDALAMVFVTESISNDLVMATINPTKENGMKVSINMEDEEDDYKL